MTTNNQQDDKMRAAFEKQFAEEIGGCDWENITVIEDYVQFTLGWQAALASREQPKAATTVPDEREALENAAIKYGYLIKCVTGIGGGPEFEHFRDGWQARAALPTVPDDAVVERVKEALKNHMTVCLPTGGLAEPTEKQLRLAATAAIAAMGQPTFEDDVKGMQCDCGNGRIGDAHGCYSETVHQQKQPTVLEKDATNWTEIGVFLARDEREKGERTEMAGEYKLLEPDALGYRYKEAAIRFAQIADALFHEVLIASEAPEIFAEDIKSGNYLMGAHKIAMEKYCDIARDAALANNKPERE